MEVENPGGEIQGGAEEGVNVDQLLSDIAAGKETNAEQPEAEAKPQEAPQWNGEEWAFEVNGKRIIPDSREKMKLWLGGGYNYAQRLGELNKTHAEKMAAIAAKEKEFQTIQERYAPYERVDQYVEKNPEWWQHVQQAWANRETQGLDPKLAQVLNPLQEKIGALEQLLTTQQQAAQQAQLEAEIQQADAKLDDEIESVRKTYPDIDLSARDDSGETLERRVLMHAREIGTQSFRAAFRDLLFDQLTVQKQAATKLQAVKGTQAQAKAGVLGTTPAPTKQLKPVDPRVPWSDPSLSVQEILKEYRSINGG